jgi:hypothetical protein
MPSTFRIASYNVENLFERPRARNLSTWAEGKPILEQHARINELLKPAAGCRRHSSRGSPTRASSARGCGAARTGRYGRSTQP